jgi:hypothetical protein
VISIIHTALLDRHYKAAILGNPVIGVGYMVSNKELTSFDINDSPTKEEMKMISKRLEGYNMDQTNFNLLNFFRN